MIVFFFVEHIIESPSFGTFLVLFIQLFQNIHRIQFFAEVTLVQLGLVDRFIQALQLR